MAQPDYSLPAWEQQSADPADFWLKGMQLGASVQHARNQLDLQAQTTALETSVKQEQAQAAHMLQQQQLEQNQAYKQAQMGIQQQKLQEAQQQINLKTQQAGQAFIAQRAYQQTVQQLMDSGMSEEQASMTAMLRIAPMMKASGSSVASLSKGLTQAKTPESLSPQFFKDPNSGATIAMGPKGHILRTDTGTGRNLAGVQTKLGFADLTDLRRQRDAMAKALAGDDTGKSAFNTPEKELGESGKRDKARYTQGQAQLKAINDKIEQTRSGILGGSPASASTSTGTPRFRFDPKTGDFTPIEAPQPTDEEPQPWEE